MSHAKRSWGMRISLDRKDLRTPLIGAATAAVVGIMLGGAMHPNLSGDFVAPQTLIPGGGARDASYASDAGASRYQGQVPEYVIGTDWTRPRAPEAVMATAAPMADDDTQTDLMAYTAHEEPRPEMIRASLEPAAPQATDYPSRSGGAVYEANLPSPPPAPSASDATADNG